MEPLRKRTKFDITTGTTLLLRLCDAFVRTDGNVICPIIKAENSIRVLYKLQYNLFKDILVKVVKEIGLNKITINYKSQTSHTIRDGNLFMKCEVSWWASAEKLTEILASAFKRDSKVKDVLIDIVQDEEEILPQPMISETDFELYKLELCYKALSDVTSDSDAQDESHATAEAVKNLLGDLKEHHTKIAVLSQNGKGKSFFLNLLFLMTSDIEEEYRENNMNLKLPKDVTGNPKLQDLENEDLINLPEVVRDLIKTNQNENQDFKSLMESVELSPLITQDVQNSNDEFSGLSTYFTKRSRIEVAPYLLAQKNLQRSYDSTTKCIIHLRYGSVYQLKVEYFEEEDLQAQLFELVSLIKGGTSKHGINKTVQDRSIQCLKARFPLLTDYGISELNDLNKHFLQRFNSYEDITLSKNVKHFAGKTELYIGSGKNSSADRVALQTVLRRLTSIQDVNESETQEWKHRVAAVKEIVVYLPSKILYGGKEILEMPGTDDSDPLAMDFIQKALNTVDVIFIISEFAFKIAEREVKEILLNSEFMKAWRKTPENYSIMFLAYPEKDSNFQFSEKSGDKIKELLKLEKYKRTSELEELCKLLDMDSLTNAMDKSIFTSYILPVLHTSIHMQEGPPQMIIRKNAEFLKFTGIMNLITHLDSFVAFKQKDSINQVENYLTNVNKKTQTVVTKQEPRHLLQMLKTKDLKSIIEDAVYNRFDRLLSHLQLQLTIMYGKRLDDMLKKRLASAVQEAEQRWEDNKDQITHRGIFNPYFCGNNATYKVRLTNVFFNDTESHVTEIFDFLMGEIKKLHNEYRNNVWKIFAEQLNTMWSDTGFKNYDFSEFVKQTSEDHLSEALKWYIGKKRMPIDKQTITKYFDNSKKSSLKRNILTPAYNLNDLDRAKQMTKRNISRAVMDVRNYFINSLFKLHNIRWKSFTSQLKTRKGQPKLWHILLGRLKQIGLDKTAPSKELFEAVKLMSTRYNS
ncbi:uncharacterized protein LOC128480798 [Spea bombifrons]|uniref:uncharacterized protein LOC128480798 n=1 Tax=Spea bombifrons TaxID=233779 RepID=UPI0023490676|nr:uncharacterized protein LOC128480798 [Spea bombifrons]